MAGWTTTTEQRSLPSSLGDGAPPLSLPGQSCGRVPFVVLPTQTVTVRHVVRYWTSLAAALTSKNFSWRRWLSSHRSHHSHSALASEHNRTTKTTNSIIVLLAVRGKGAAAPSLKFWAVENCRKIFLLENVCPRSKIWCWKAVKLKFWTPCRSFAAVCRFLKKFAVSVKIAKLLRV